jgi:hypothetical protein
VRERIVILFLGHPSGSLRVLCHRDWRNIVGVEDLEYVSDLMDDFRERARSTPDALFRQVSSLSVGPLVTYAVGSDYDLQPLIPLLELCENMVELS